MEWLLLLTLGGGAAFYAGRKVIAARADRRERAEEFAGVQRLADEDVTVFGEQLQRVGGHVADRDLDAAARSDYETALDAYDRAKQDAPKLRDLDAITGLAETLASGRYALACVEARMAGEPVPERRVPCFFNPQHGPSAQEVEWTTTRHGTRRVPGCRLCAARVAAREKPDARTVRVGNRTVPYFEAGTAYHSYSRGYFPAGSSAAASVESFWVFEDLGRIQNLGGGGMDGGFGGDFGGGGFDGGGDFGGGGDN